MCVTRQKYIVKKDPRQRCPMRGRTLEGWGFEVFMEGGGDRSNKIYTPYVPVVVAPS